MWSVVRARKLSWKLPSSSISLPSLSFRPGPPYLPTLSNKHECQNFNYKSFKFFFVFIVTFKLKAESFKEPIKKFLRFIKKRFLALWVRTSSTSARFEVKQTAEQKHIVADRQQWNSSYNKFLPISVFGFFLDRLKKKNSKLRRFWKINERVECRSDFYKAVHANRWLGYNLCQLTLGLSNRSTTNRSCWWQLNYFAQSDMTDKTILQIDYR